MEIDEIPVGRAEDLRGQKFGQVTVLYRVKAPETSSEQRKAYWKCRCDCGNEFIVLGRYLRNGQRTSCGCSKKVKLIPYGTHINHLTILERVGSMNGRVAYKCQCDCGNFRIVDSHQLNQGGIRSCGCTTASMGEKKIKQLLDDNNIQYITQYGFKECTGLKGWKLRFDFYVNNNYCIEYDGLQHFEIIKSWGEDSFKTTQYNDQIKNKYCLSHNIPLIRIPYTHYDKITIDDLRPETSQFLI